MKPSIVRQIQLVLAGFLAAIGAAVFTIYAFNLSTPPRDINMLLAPTPTRTSIALALPTATLLPTPTPAPTNLIYSADLTIPGDWPDNIRFHYTKTGYLLSASPQSDFLAVPLAGFDDSSLQDLTLVAEATPGQNSATEYGIFFWHSTDSQGRERFLSLTITPRRTFRLRGYGPFTTTKGDKALRWVDLVSETPSRNIRIDGRPNQLRVELRQSQIRVLINGFEVLNRDNEDIDQYRFRSDFDAHVGLLAVPAGTEDAPVEFKLFQLYYNDTQAKP
ncbi:MAG: hypothetical protein WCF84_19670 [Anaerolineae bacterium]